MLRRTSAGCSSSNPRCSCRSTSTFSHSAISRSTRTRPRHSLELRSSLSNKRVSPLATSRHTWKETKCIRSISKSWVKRSVWEQNEQQCSQVERHLVERSLDKHDSICTHRAYQRGIIVCAWEQAGFSEARRHNHSSRLVWKEIRERQLL